MRTQYQSILPGGGEYYQKGIDAETIDPPTDESAGMFDSAFGENGWVSPVANAGLGLYQAYLGRSQLKEAQQQNRFNRVLGASNFNNSVTAYN